jgi:hypothetical protein
MDSFSLVRLVSLVSFSFCSRYSPDTRSTAPLSHFLSPSGGGRLRVALDRLSLPKIHTRPSRASFSLRFLSTHLRPR